MQTNLIHTINAQWCKSAEADMQCDSGNLNTAHSNGFKNSRSEVQPCRRRGDRASLRSEDSLVALAIGIGIFAPDVRRQGNVANLFENSKEIFHRSKAQRALTELAARDDLRLQHNCAGRSSKRKMITYADLASRTHQRVPVPCFIR